MANAHRQPEHNPKIGTAGAGVTLRPFLPTAVRQGDHRSGLARAATDPADAAPHRWRHPHPRISSPTVIRRPKSRPLTTPGTAPSTKSDDRVARRCGHAPENLSTTAGYQKEIDVMDASRSLQSIGDMRRTPTYSARRIPITVTPHPRARSRRSFRLLSGAACRAESPPGSGHRRCRRAQPAVLREQGSVARPARAASSLMRRRVSSCPSRSRAM